MNIQTEQNINKKKKKNKYQALSSIALSNG